MKQSQELFVVVAPGLEGVVVQELAALSAPPLRLVSGGVAFDGALDWIYRSNLCLRVANRVLLRVGSFYAENLRQIERKARQLPWSEHLSCGQAVRIKASARSSRTRHTGAVEERVRLAIAEALGTDPSPGDENSVQVVVRIIKNICTVSVDTSGAPLHERGYRQNVGKAPMRETLAAGFLRLCGWDGSQAFMDPMCGSGTLAIEAALLAAGIPPGANRKFAFMERPDFDPSLWTRVRDEAMEGARTPSVPIVASDRNEGAITATTENAQRAGVADHLEVVQTSISGMKAPASTGLLLSNPPYGKRIGQKDKLRDLYAALGNEVRGKLPEWNVGLICNDKMLVSQTRIGLKPATPYLPHGGLKVQLFLRWPTPSAQVPQI